MESSGTLSRRLRNESASQRRRWAFLCPAWVGLLSRRGPSGKAVNKLVDVSSPSLPDNKNTQPYLHISSKLTHGMNAPCAGLRWRWRWAKQAVTATPHELRLQHVALPSACRSALSHRRRRFYPIGARPKRGQTLQPAQLPGQHHQARLGRSRPHSADAQPSG